MARILDEISVFFPAYNEEDNIESTVWNARAVLLKKARKWEIIIVDDGSTDKTLEISQKLHLKDKRIRVISHKRNRGYGAAFKSGLYASCYSWISFTDSDGQFDFSEIDKFINKQSETQADIVIGYYLGRKVPFSVKVTSKLWEALVFVFFGLWVSDIDCGFKFISKRVVDSISRLESERGAFISSEFLIKAKKKGFVIKEVGVNHYERKGGKPTGRDIDVIIQSFKDLFKLWRKLR